MAVTPPENMDEKVSSSPDNGYASHNESSQNEKFAQDSGPEIINSSGRRQSVALNIVENPLKVGFTSQADALMSDSSPSYSISPRSKQSQMPESLPSPMDWLSKPLFLSGLLSSRVTVKGLKWLLNSKSKSVLPSFTRGSTNGMGLSCSGIPLLYAPWELPRRGGIRLDPTELTCHSLRNLASPVRGGMNGLWESSMPLSS